MTIELCKDTCISAFHRNAGVENGNDCYCGDNVPDLNILPVEDCDFECSGNSTQICGGETKMNIYSLTTKCEKAREEGEVKDIQCDAQGAFIPRQCQYDLESTFCCCFTTAGEEISGTRIYPYFQQMTDLDVHCPEYYVGECVLDNESNRILTGHSFQDEAMTQEKCKTTCNDLQFNYAGVEEADVCFCGNTIPDLTFLPSSECNYECPGNSTEMCGGDAQMTIFTLPYILRNFPNATTTE